MRPTPSHPDSDSDTQPAVGSFDGEGAGDHDLPYQFGRRPRAITPFPFSTRQYARLLILRSHVRTFGDPPGLASAS